MTAPHSQGEIVRVGIIGCGEVTQVVHIPTLGFLSDLFQVVALCDVSDNALAHCKSKVLGPAPSTTRSAAELCANSDVDVVLIASSDAFHVAHILLGLKHNKIVFVEKPMATSLKDADAVIQAEKASSGKVMVGYMRRYAAAFVDAVQEVGGLEKILYARVRDIIGPNASFVGQSGTFPKSFHDFTAEDSDELVRQTHEILNQAISHELGVSVTPALTKMWRLLGGLGSHDLSAMREVLGQPIKALGASLCNAEGPPFWSALFQYPGFTVSYESGIDNVPRFDASIEIFGVDKTIKILYDTPYVKGLPVSLQIRERGADGSYRESNIRKTYEDPYTLEMKELYEVVTKGKAIKTTALDARQDIDIFNMIVRAGLGFPQPSEGVATNGV